ncbi:MAG: Uma2 family endonuclease [Pseudanabaena sp.]|jgi:Uma2 family endonuclease
MVVQTLIRQKSIEEHLVEEETAEQRSEYCNGEIIVMAGGSINHNRIIRNFSRLLESQSYEVFISDLRLWIPAYNEYTYPDILLIKGEPIFQENRTDTVINPSIIIEVLSKSTSNRDRGDKFAFYRSLNTFQEYILVDQYRVHIEQFRRNDDGNWLLSESDNQSGILTLADGLYQISHRDIYAKVKFDQA